MNALIDFFLRVANLCRKELLTILKDPATRAILIAPAIMQSLVFGYGATYDLTNVPYALLDQSRNGASTELIAHLDSTGVFHRVATLRSQADIREVIDTEKALLVIQIPANFEQQLSAGQTAAIQLILDARNSNTAGSAAGYVSAVVERYNAELRTRVGAPPSPLVVESRAWFNPNLETRWNLLPGMIAALSMLQTLLLTALSVAREREQGTFDQLLVTPMSPLEIMIGKALPPVLVGLVQSSLILLVALFWFGIPMAGSLVTLYTGLLFFTVASVGIGLSISAVSANMQQAMLYAFVLLMPLMLLSGLTTPVRNMPHALQVATLANPLRFAIDLVQRVYLEGVGLGTVWHNLIPLAVIAAVTLPLAAWLFRNRLV
ncbi:ABC-2 type transport system permease protein [Variovorax sp. YR634]|jgi:ABC-2 type transport system permease protein|uniref:ABC transporter permease n=1 Tax=unclassified Variovorax TaxID=663243 RepID=UPI000894C1D7|nr:MULTISPECIES: ABC transporter permease [unclassified Variovorax]SDW80668.1 ABC-2 type transport system permease protein [Variovorax sp. YR634]SDZ53386.1 ABC-2 type transport system permease protein [Variovorax sp. YR266]SOD26679.1 ABC-2 type transport system permease protein [Variovorax sp. YR752]